MPYQTIDPSNGKLVKTFADHTDLQLESFIAHAETAFQTDWKQRGIAERKKIMKQAAAILHEQRDRFAQLVTLEMGKLFKEACGEVDLSAAILDYYADNAEAFLAPKKLPVQNGEAFVESEPLGIIFCVEPWNFPYYQLARVAGPNLMAGNTLIVKHAPNVPQCAEAFEQLFLDAGAPVGVYTNAFISNDQSATLIADSRIKGVALTGSERAGSAVASEAGKALKKSTMELGGSDAFIVLDDADMNLAVKWGLFGRMNNTGQSCVAAKRFILHEKIADIFLERFVAELKKLKAGDPMDSSTTLAPLCTEGALALVLKQIDDATKGGGKVLLGGNRIDRPGYYLSPTVLTDVKAGNPVFHQEFFSPVTLVFRVSSDDEAVKLANDSPYGLGGSVITQNIERGKQIARKIDTGMMFINQSTNTAPDLPFGGVKNSGFGRELSELGIHEFVNKKLIRIAETHP